jgi:hypothetical protein
MARVTPSMLRCLSVAAGALALLGCGSDAAGVAPETAGVGGTGGMLPSGAGVGGLGVAGSAAGGSALGGSSGGGAGAAGGAGGAGGSVGTGGASGSAGAGAGPGSLLDPSCWDGVVYAAEKVPPMHVAIDDLIPQFSVAARTPWSIQVLERRYPLGAELLRIATMKDLNGEGNCYGIAYQPADGWQKIIGGFRTAVHECGHMTDLQFGRYMIRTDLEYACKNDVWDASPMRSEILKDEFDALGPKGGNLDFQRDVYLKPTGNPGSGGDERFNLLFTEFSQYVNTLATSMAVYDYAPDDSIAGDASRDFAWFIERYLRIMRAKYPAEYPKLGEDPCWRRLVLADWGKVNRYWDESRKQGLNKLESDEAAKVDVLIRDPSLLAEIENLRVLDGCRK